MFKVKAKQEAMNNNNALMHKTELIVENKQSRTEDI